MKKKYLFMSSFFVIGTILTLMFFWSYRVYDKGTQDPPAEEEVNTVDTVQEPRIHASMKYVVEVYDGTTGMLTSEEDTVPAELAGLTREELESYISSYNKTIEQNGVTDGPDSKELVSFSKDKIVIREIYSGEEEEKGFFLKIENDEVVIFHNDQVTPYEYTDIQAEVLPEEEKNKLMTGYFVADEKELYSILENLSS